MDFVLTLHSPLPWVLHHGRWPHGSDWLCEAAVDTYLPLVVALETLDHQRVQAPITLGVTPILANQLAHPDFRVELEAFFAQRLEACDEAVEEFRGTPDAPLVPIAQFWRARMARLRRVARRHDYDITGMLGRLARQGRIELLSSAATHGFLPLLGRDESIRLQLLMGRAEHRRLFGLEARGCWAPECAYRPAGPWSPDPQAPAQPWRTGIETHLRDAGFDHFYVDSHLASAGRMLGLYGEQFVDGIREPSEVPLDTVYPRSPYRAYDLLPDRGAPVAALVRDPESSQRVWSRYHGYPGDGGYLEFHKIHWPGGLKFWRVTRTSVGPGAKRSYDANVARARSHGHAADYAALLVRLTGETQPLGGELVVAPFDTELFGHWWFEGVDWITDLYRALQRQATVSPATATAHLDRRTGGHPTISLVEGSWGANGDFSMWLNPGTAWTWHRLWALEERFWSIAPRILSSTGEPAREILAQATRELLLAQSSDWQFIISTGAAADYAERRFVEHCEGAEGLLAGLEAGSDESLASARELAGRLGQVDDPFPDPLPVLRAAMEAPK